MRVLILHPIPSPYREKLFAEIAGLDEIELVVYYCAQSIPSYSDWHFESQDYHQKVLKGYRIRGGLFFNPSIVKQLLNDRPHIIIVWGWTHPTAQLALLFARILGIPSIVFSDSPWPVRKWKSPTIDNNIQKLKSLLLKLPHTFVVQGELAKQYVLSLGVKQNQLHIIPMNCVDTKVLFQQATSARFHSHRIKERFGIKASRVVIYVGRLVQGKGLDVMLNAYFNLRQNLSDIALLIVGGGTERSFLEAQVLKLKLPDVIFVGPQSYEVLPEFYGLSDCLVLPTFSDTWGLVILEALACGVPVISTTRCGSTPDLIKDHGTGLIVEPNDEMALAQAIEYILSLSPKETEKMRQRGLETVANYDYRKVARSLVDLIKLKVK